MVLHEEVTYVRVKSIVDQTEDRISVNKISEATLSLDPSFQHHFPDHLLEHKLPKTA